MDNRTALQRAKDVRKQAAELTLSVSRMTARVTDKRPPWVRKLEKNLIEAGSKHFTQLRIMDNHINLLQAEGEMGTFEFLSPTALRGALSDWREARRQGDNTDIDSLIACAIEVDLSDESEGGSTLEKIQRRAARKTGGAL